MPCVVCQHKDAVITCLLCNSMYHQACWDYMGRCALFGCPSIHNSSQLAEFQALYKKSIRPVQPTAWNHVTDLFFAFARMSDIPTLIAVLVAVCSVVFLVLNPPESGICADVPPSRTEEFVRTQLPAGIPVIDLENSTIYFNGIEMVNFKTTGMNSFERNISKFAVASVGDLEYLHCD